MMYYQIEFTPEFLKRLQKIKLGDFKVYLKVKKLLQVLSESPFYKGLETHKVNSKKYGLVYALRITGDLRLLWDFADSNVVVVLTIGGHSGKRSVY